MGRSIFNCLMLAPALGLFACGVFAAEPKPDSSGQKEAKGIFSRGMDAYLKMTRRTPPVEPTSIMAALQAMFTGGACPLPPPLLKELSGKPYGVIPEELAKALDAQPNAPVLSVKAAPAGNQDVMDIMHAVTVLPPSPKPATSTSTSTPPSPAASASSAVGTIVVASNSVSYTKSDPASMIKRRAPNVLFAYDCSGFLNAALNASGALPGVDVQTALSTAVSKKAGIYVARASVYSPAATALNPNLFPPEERLNQTVKTRMDLLFALSTQIRSQDPQSSDDYTILAPSLTDLVWASASGTSFAQGKADLNTNLSPAIGVASLTMSTSAGASLTQTMSFGSFVTYVLISSET